jgi:HSP20 family protein
MRALIRRSDVQDPFEVMDRMLNRWAGVGEVPAQLAPYAVDVHEDADHIYVEAELPGFNKDEVNITLEEGVLTIQAERKTETKQRDPLHIERRWTQFQRAFTLPTAVNENTVKASMNSGVLTVTLDKREEVKPRKISITAEEGDGAHKPVEVKSDATPKK